MKRWEHAWRDLKGISDLNRFMTEMGKHGWQGWALIAEPDNHYYVFLKRELPDVEAAE